MERVPIIKFTVEFVSRDVPRDERVRELRAWCDRFNESGLTPELPGEGRSLGNLSFRLKAGATAFVVTASALPSKGELFPEDFVEVAGADLERNTVFASGAKLPSSESMMHHEIYARRPDVNAIFHGHDKEITANAALLHLPETEREQPPRSQDLLREALKVLGKEKFVILKKHGFLSLGETMEEAGNRAFQIRQEMRMKIGGAKS